MMHEISDYVEEVKKEPEFSQWEDAFYQALPKDESGSLDVNGCASLLREGLNSVTKPGFQLSDNPQTVKFLTALVSDIVNKKKERMSIGQEILLASFASSDLGRRIISALMSIK